MSMENCLNSFLVWALSFMECFWLEFVIDLIIVEGFSSSRSFVRDDHASMFFEVVYKIKTNKLECNEVNWMLLNVLVLT